MIESVCVACSGGSILLDILPSQGDEEEKVFTVYLLSASNEVQIDQEREAVTITVDQRGMPYGTVGFFGDVLSPHKVDEGGGRQSVAFPLSRTAPALGDVQISFTVTGQTLQIHTRLFCIMPHSVSTQIVFWSHYDCQQYSL